MGDLFISGKSNPYRIAVPRVAIAELHHRSIGHGKLRGSAVENTACKHGELTALNGDLSVSSEIHGVKLNSDGIFHDDLRIEILASREYVAAIGTADENTDPTVISAMVEGTSHHRAVSVVPCISVRIVNRESDLIGVESAVHENVISAVIETAVEIFTAVHIGKLVILAEMRNADTRAAIDDMTVRSSHSGSDMISRIRAGKTASRKAIHHAFHSGQYLLG